MKRTLKSSLSIILALVFVFSIVSCGTQDTSALWENATYRSDAEFGEGATTFKFEVKAGEKIVTFTIHTDKDTVGEALIEHGLIAGEDSQYGLYVKVVNGMTADYDINQSYWAFYINGESAMTGVDKTNITEGGVYQLAYTK